MQEKNLTLHFIITEIKMVIFLQRIVKIRYTNSQTHWKKQVTLQ